MHLINDAVAELFASAPASSGADVGNLLDVQLIEAVDVSNAIAWLVSDEARYVTAVALPVDAGFTASSQDLPIHISGHDAAARSSALCR